MARTGKAKKTSQNDDTEAFIIDVDKGLSFSSEEEVYHHFAKQIDELRDDLHANRKETDIPLESIGHFSNYFHQTLSQPDEVWEDSQRFEEFGVNTYISRFDSENHANGLFYIAVTYVTQGQPTFIFLHFPTSELDLVEHFRRGKLIYERIRDASALEATDALAEGEELAIGLHKAMLTLRADNDIPEEDFDDYLRFRDDTLELPDEIWKNEDLQGNVLVNFIKEYSTDEDTVYYVVVTVEEAVSESHYLLFSFPTRDVSLVDRYRHGEELSTEQFTREESH